MTPTRPADGHLVHLPAPVVAALAVAFGHAPPAWLVASSRCGTGGAALYLADDDQADELADLVALAWWEAIQDDNGRWGAIFAEACEKLLTLLPQRPWT